MILEVDRRKH